jgi:hypothetical protein
MSNQDQKAIFITGSSSGLGRATAKLFAAKEWKVIASMRNPDKEKELTKTSGVALLRRFLIWLRTCRTMVVGCPILPHFGGTISVTPYPVRLGTTYLDAGRVLKPGSVTEYDRLKHLSFHHTVQLRQSFLNTDVDARIRYTFGPKDAGTFVDRSLF